MRIAIIGAGAVGAWFGGRMAAAGVDVCFIARGESLEQIRSRGLSLTDEHGRTTFVKAPAAETFDELQAMCGPIDVFIAATKALPGQDPFPQIPSGMPLVTTHNSVEIPYLAAERLGADYVYPGIIRGYFIHTGPAAVEFRPGPQSLNVGTFDGRSSELVDELMACLHTAGIGGEHLPNIWVDVWTKAMFVATTGALGALAEQPIGYLRTVMRSSLQRAVAEVVAVARAHKVPLPEDIVEQTMAFADLQGPDNTTSMQRDIAAGLASELDAQIGAIRRMGERVGMATPLLDLIHGALEGRMLNAR